MKTLVFGRTGQVARALQAQAEVIALGRDSADLSRPATCADAIHEARPDIVINAAAYTAVDRAEDEPKLAHTVNCAAPGAMAKACAALDIPFLHISTDYVFDGAGTAPFQPEAPISPLGVYGRTKAEGEAAVRATGARHVILRTSWVFSEHGANFVKTMLRLSETRSALSVVDDQIGGPTPAGDIAEALLVMALPLSEGHAGGTYHYAGVPSVSWCDFAREIFRASGRSVDVTGIPSADYPTPARRPLNSRLDCMSTTTDFGIAPPDWKAALADIIERLRT
ncbi:dTDP-4-dehydrorhamnose reductase [Roseovarius aquimarinus]|uniref:dTDP-4-dehydrorhamnose reductase n=1 Tax=Roseovarius aquimarinus TaxID=1229156 RepID=A0ABW7IA97_9RHOB